MNKYTLKANGVKWILAIIVVPRKKIAGILAIILILTGIMFYAAHYEQALRTESILRNLTIVIDPGHGGVDGGTRDDQGNMEKDINLAIGLKLWGQLRQSGLNVLITRETDTDLSPFISGRTGRHRKDLLARIQKARENRSLFLLSIHCDWSEARYRRGVVAFYNYLSPLSKMLALSIQEELNRVQDKPQKAAPGNYFIIRQHGVTGVLVEVGFLSNAEDAKQLRDPTYQEKLALAIAAGILKKCRIHIPEKRPTESECPAGNGF
ncbi:MAG: N-acetylmuramoyl-L-alanine amidase family protein [Bacillota bacterium]